MIAATLFSAMLGLALAGAPEVPAAAVDPELGQPFDSPPSPALVTERTETISSKLRCPVCQGLSVNDSNSDAARAMKGRIRDLVAQGYTGDQINDYFIDRYGAWVLLEPKAEGLNWLVWIGPVAALGLGTFFVGWQMVSSRRSDLTPGAPPPTTPAVEVPDDEYARRVLAELGEMVGGDNPPEDN